MATGHYVADGTAHSHNANDRVIKGTNSSGPKIGFPAETSPVRQAPPKKIGNVLQDVMIPSSRPVETEVYLRVERKQPGSTHPALARQDPRRIEDVFQDVIIPNFNKVLDFKKFARSSKGLSLGDDDIENIMEDYRHAEDQKYQMLLLWKQKNYRNASSARIIAIMENYPS